MARPLRVNMEDGWYHACAPGLNRMCIYGDDRDREHFLERRPFGSVPVENGAWGYELSLYLHLNPLRIKALGLDKRERKVARKARGSCAGG